MASTEQETDIGAGARFFSLLWSYRYALLLVPLLAMGGAYGVAKYGLREWFTASVNIIPQKVPGSGGLGGMIGNLSSTLKDFGMTKLGGGAGGEAYSHLVLLGSRRVKDSLIERFDLFTEYEIPRDRRDLVYLELEGNMSALYEREGNYVLTITHPDREKSAVMANYAAELGNRLAIEIAQNEARLQRENLEKNLRRNQYLFQQAADSLKIFANKYKILSPEGQAASMATGIGELRASVIQQEIKVQVAESAFGADDPQTKTQASILAQLKEQLRKAESEPGYLIDFPLSQGGNIAVTYGRLLADVETYGKMRAVLMPMYEEALLNEQRAIAPMYILDKAVPPIQKTYPRRAMIVLGTGVGTFVVLVLLIALYDRWRYIRTRHPELF